MQSRFHRFAVLLLAGGICGILWIASAVAGKGGDNDDDAVIPKGYPVERYTSLWERSPFALASVQQEVAQASFAQGLAVVGIAKIGDDDLVTVLNKQSQERMTLSADPNAQGIKVVSVSSDADPLKVKVTLQKGSETATVGFDRTLLAMIQTPPPPVESTTALTISQAASTPQAGNTPPAPARQIIRLPPLPVTKPAAVPAASHTPAAGAALPSQ